MRDSLCIAVLVVIDREREPVRKGRGKRGRKAVEVSGEGVRWGSG